MSLAGQRIEVNDVTLNVIIKGEGHPVLLLHGFPDSAYLWRNQIRSLAANGYKVIAPDLRGFGDSSAPEGKKHYTFEVITSDVITLLDHLAIGKAFVIGHDLGAVVGWLLAIYHPDRVARYVAISVGHPRAYRSGIEQKLRAWYALGFQVPFVSEWVVRAFDWFIFRKMTGSHPEADHWFNDLSRKGLLTAGLNWYRANMFRILFEDFPNAKVPILGIWSTGDGFLSQDQMKNSSRYVDGDWRYERFEGPSHWIPLDAPDQLNTLLLTYLSQPSLNGKSGWEKTEGSSGCKT